MDAGIDLARVAVRADLDVDLPVGTERSVFPVVMHGIRQSEFLGQVDRRAGVVELVFDVVVTQHAIDREHVERTLMECQAIRLREALREDLGLAPVTLVGNRIDAADHPRAHEDRAFVATNHGPRAGMPTRPHLGLETGRQLDLVDRQFVCGGRNRRHRNRLQPRVLLALRRVGLVHRAETRRRLRKGRCHGGTRQQGSNRCSQNSATGAAARTNTHVERSPHQKRGSIPTVPAIRPADTVFRPIAGCNTRPAMPCDCRVS